MRFIGILMTILAWASAAGAAGEMKMSEPIRLSFAGASIALPEGYEIMTGPDPFIAIQAVRRVNGEDVMLVKLSAWPVPKVADGATLMKQHNAQVNRNLAVRRMKVLKSAQLKVSGLDATVQVQTYTNRGVEIMALRMAVARPVPDDKFDRGMGYILTIESDKAHRGDAMPALRAILPSIKLFDPVAPVAEKVEALGPVIESKVWGYSFRPPAMWKVTQQEAGRALEFRQTDYLSTARPESSPRGFVAAQPEQGNAEACGVEQAQALLKALQAQQQMCSPPKYSKVKVAGHDAHEFVLRSVSTRPGEKQRSRVFVQRNLCINGLRYTLSLVYRTADEAIPRDTMEKMAAGMKVFRPAGLSQPATTAPATTNPSGTDTPPD